MKRIAFALVIAPIFLMPFAASAEISHGEAQPPGQCERSCRYTNYSAQCSAGGVLKGTSIDAQCAQSRLGVPTYTAQLTTFGNTNGCHDSSSNYANGVEQCSSGSCTTYGGQAVMGMAHRTFPMGTRIEVCNLNKPGVCAIATVVDRGPADYLTNRTIDAYSTLSAALQMNCGTVPATYKVLSGPGINGDAQPSGPTVPGVEAILAAQRNGSGVPVQGVTYQAMQTPWGYGYVGTPPPIGSSAYAAVGAPAYNTPYTQTYPATPIQQTNTTFPSQTDTSSSANTSSKPGAPALDIKVWPHTLYQGQTLLVYWTSVNMPTGSCQVIFQNQNLADGNAGTKPFKTTSFDPGKITFTLQCLDANGVQRSATDSATLLQ